MRKGNLELNLIYNFMQKIQFIRQHDGMLCEAITRRDISKEYKQHYELLIKFRRHRATFSDADCNKMAELEDFIIASIDWDTVEELGVNSSPFVVEDNITMLHC